MNPFKVIYINKKNNYRKEYKINSFLGSELIKELYYMEYNKDSENDKIELYLELYEDIFNILRKNTEFKIKYSEIDDIKYVSTGLKYFISDRLGEFILCIKNDMYNAEKQKVREFFEKLNIKRKNGIEGFLKNPSIPLEYFLDHKNDIYWPNLCENPSITIDFLERNNTQIDWEQLCKNTSIPIQFFEENIDRIASRPIPTFLYLCANPSVPVEFFTQYVEFIDQNDAWEDLCKNPSIPIEFFKEHIDKLMNDSCFINLSSNPSIPIEFFRDHIDIIDRLNLWKYLCKNPSITIKFLEDYLEKIDWYLLCANSSVPLEFFIKYKHNIFWPSLCHNSSIPVEFFIENFYKIDWESICLNTSIPLEFFKEHLDKVSWKFLARNPSIPLEFLKEHLDKIKEYDILKNPSITVEFIEQNLDMNKVRYAIDGTNPFGIEKKVEKYLNSLDPIFNDKYIQTSSIVLNCLKLFRNSDIAIIEKILSFICMNEYPLMSNTVLCSQEKNEYYYIQIKHFLCTLKKGNAYEEDLKKLCNIQEEKEEQEEKQQEEKQEDEDMFTINIYDMDNPIHNVKDSEKVQIFVKKHKSVILVKEGNIFQDTQSSDKYTVYDLDVCQGMKATIIK